MNCNRKLFVVLTKNYAFITAARNSGVWSGVPQGPPDPILGLGEAYRHDKDPRKVNLGIGAYRDDDCKPYVLPVVRKAEKLVQAMNLNKEYLPITGSAEFCKLTIQLALGDSSEHVKNGLCATIQSLSGTGAVRVGLDFVKAFYPHDKTVYLPKPTWGNHNQMVKQALLPEKSYTYYDPKTLGLDFKGMMEDLAKFPDKAIILLHGCAHNPTGVDPTPQQWDEISALMKKKNQFPFFDLAYQGFASGDAEKDVYAIRKLVSDGSDIILCQSYAKNMGLYGERVGGLTVLTKSKEETAKVLSQLKILIRGSYSNPPCNGARIVTKILEDQSLKAEWFQEFKGMSDRITSMRKMLKNQLKKEGSSRNWDHITQQIGMFCFTGLTPPQVDKMVNEHHIYMTKNGRISVAGLAAKNVEYVGHAIHLVTK